MTLILDTGSFALKSGLSDTSSAPLTTRTLLCRPSSAYLASGDDVTIGCESIPYYNRQNYVFDYPLDHGIVGNWESLEFLWSHVITGVLGTGDAAGSRVLCTEAVQASRGMRERTAEIMIETFQFDAVALEVGAILALFGRGKSTGVVLDSGEGVTYVVPVFEGCVARKAVARKQIGGKDVTRWMSDVMNQRKGHLVEGGNSAELEMVREIKERVCQVSQSQLVTPHPADQSHSYGDSTVEEYVSHQLPDGQYISLGDERFRAPEALFNPSIANWTGPGVHEMVYNAIMKTDLDARRELFGNIFLSGGNTAFQGFHSRFTKEVANLAPSTVSVKVHDPNEDLRINGVFYGASVMASLSTAESHFMTKEEFGEYGAALVGRKSYW